MLKVSAILVVVTAAVAFLWRVSSLGAGELATHPNLDTDAVEAAVQHLQTAKQGLEMNSVRVGITQALKSLGEEHFASQMLSTASSEAASDIELLKKGIDRVIESLTFRPWMEAEIPEGFPAFTPVHHIEVKRLPTYRMARAAMSITQQRGENSAFWKLFSHIKRNDIAMTAPVQMDYSGNDGDAAVNSMAFLYGSMKIGAPGADSSDGSVKVVDVPEQEVVSIGLRGRMSAESVEGGHRALLKWLVRNRADYRATGTLRRMGYNSPFVPQNRAFFELQIPVEKVDSTKVAEAETSTKVGQSS